MSTIRERRLELAGFGTRALQLDPGADGAGPPLVLLHGFSDSADTWRPVLGELGRQGRSALALDLPGFGQADRLDREAEVLPQLDRFVAAAVRHASREAGGVAVVVSGNSLGGLAALRAAEDRELPIAAIVPVAPAGLDMAGWIAIVEGAPLIRTILRAPVPLPELAVREAVGRVYRVLAFARPGAVDAAVVSSFTRHVRSRRDVVRMAGTARRLRPEIQQPFRLERITCRVLVVWGDRDRMVFASGAERILAEVEDAHLELIEDCGHCPQVECPERLGELLGAFPGVLAEAA
ncbi:MAG: alpha/beta fold hydrolase [Solirubrobacterales bacterium]